MVTWNGKFQSTQKGYSRDDVKRDFNRFLDEELDAWQRPDQLARMSAPRPQTRRDEMPPPRAEPRAESAPIAEVKPRPHVTWTQPRMKSFEVRGDRPRQAAAQPAARHASWRSEERPPGPLARLWRKLRGK